MPPTPPGRRHPLHGRRQGRPLRDGLKRLVQERLPALSVSLPEPGARLDLASLFGPQAREIWLEIGFGAGEHLAWQAAANRDVGLLGAEVFINGIASLLRRIEADELDNVRIFQGDARELLAALPDGLLGRVFILFPDPWPKTRHHKRRLIQRPTLDRLAALIRPGGELRVASDHDGYLDWMLARLTVHPAFAWCAEGPADWRQRPADWPPTRYEQKALGEGQKSTYLRFIRQPI